MITQVNNLNIQSGSVPVTVHLSQGDTGNTIGFYLYNGSEPFNLDGYQVSVHGIRSDGVGFGPYQAATNSNYVSFVVRSVMTAIMGACLAEFTITGDGGASVGTANFAMLVEAGTFPNGPVYDTDISVYQQILNYVQTIPANLRSELSALSARMDEFTKLPDGSLSTAADAELVDIRIGNNGVTYSTAGDAVRGNDNEVKTTLSSMITSYANGVYNGTGYNFDTNTESLWEVGLINPYGVDVDNDTTIRTSVYVPANAEVITMSRSGFQIRIAKYNVSGEFDSSSDWIGYGNAPYVLNPSYKYRVSLRNVSGGTAGVENYDVVMFLLNTHDNFIAEDAIAACTGIPDRKISGLLEWKNGYIDLSTGSIVSNVKTVVNTTLIKGKILYMPDANYEFTIGRFDLSGAFIDRLGWFQTGSYLLESDKQYRVSIRRKDGADISVDEYTAIHVYDNDDDELITSKYYHKAFSILGDSISTFAGYIPTGNGSYYPDTSRVPDVTRVQDTWWYKAMTALQMNLLINNSWSGSCVCEGGTSAETGYTRSTSLNTDTRSPDVIIFAMGVNDFLNGIQLGEYDGTQSDFPTSTTTFREGYAMTLKRMLERYPRAEVWCATIMNCERMGEVGFPEKNAQGVPLSAYNDAIRQLANLFGCKVLDFDKCGITYQNLNVYMGDWGVTGTGQGLHPNEKGHSLMANQVIRQFDNFIRLCF